MKVETVFGTINAEPATLNLISALFERVADAPPTGPLDRIINENYRETSHSIQLVLEASGYFR